MRPFAPIALAALLATSASAETHASGDAAAGEEAFGKMCVTCHVVVNEAGETLAGKKSRTGPNLYGVVGRVAGTYPEYRYGKSMLKAGTEGIVWSEDTLVAYVQNPTDWLREVLDDRRAKGKMTFRVRQEADAVNIFAFLASVGPEPAMDAADATQDAPASN